MMRNGFLPKLWLRYAMPFAYPLTTEKNNSLTGRAVPCRGPEETAAIGRLFRDALRIIGATGNGSRGQS